MQSQNLAHDLEWRDNINKWLERTLIATLSRERKDKIKDDKVTARDTTKSQLNRK
jgi:uncharacterized protein YifN (PemK superfamily)